MAEGGDEVMPKCEREHMKKIQVNLWQEDIELMKELVMRHEFDSVAHCIRYALRNMRKVLKGIRYEVIDPKELELSSRNR